MRREKEPKVSVVTISYNAEKEIEKTILSVMAQDYLNIEYIIVDGGSSDGTVEIIKKHSNGITNWISEPDGGCYDAMNKGIDMASGEWIIFMNSGDSFYSSETIRNAISKGKEYDVIYGDANVVADFGSYEIRPYPIEYLDKGVMPFYHQACFVKTAIMREHKFCLKYKICADFDVFHSIRNESKRFLYIPITMAIYDISGGSLSFDHPEAVLKENFAIMGNYNMHSYYSFYLSLFKWFIKKTLFKVFSAQDYKSKYFRHAVKNNKLTKSISW